MRKPGRAAIAAVLLTAAVTHAAGQGNLPSLRMTQDSGARQNQDVKQPDTGSHGQNPGQGPGPDQSPPNDHPEQGQPPTTQPPTTQAPTTQGQAPAGDNQPTMMVFDRLEVQAILGREVRSSANENMGRIVDVIVDRSGQVRAAIIDFGGFLGVGNRRIAVAWNALHFPPNPKDPKKVDRIVLDLNRDQVQAAPEYKEDKPVVVLGASGGLESLPFP